MHYRYPICHSLDITTGSNFTHSEASFLLFFPNKECRRVVITHCHNCTTGFASLLYFKDKNLIKNSPNWSFLAVVGIQTMSLKWLVPSQRLALSCTITTVFVSLPVQTQIHFCESVVIMRSVIIMHLHHSNICRLMLARRVWLSTDVKDALTHKRRVKDTYW